MVQNVRIFGDSQLIIKWHLGLFKKIGKRSIYQTVHGAKELIKASRLRASFRNIPRHLNAAADDMARRARELPNALGSIVLDPAYRPNLPPVDLDLVYQQQQEAQGALPLPFQAAVNAPTILEAAGRPCKVCSGLQNEETMILCECCKDAFHPDCLSEIE